MRLLAAAAGLAMLCAGSLSASAASIPAAPVGATTAQERLVTPAHWRERHHHHRRWHRHYRHHDGWNYRRWYRHHDGRRHHRHHRHHHHRRHHHHY